jgi:hypothetical protein
MHRYNSIYKYLHRYTLHHHTSFGIRLNLPSSCAAEQLQLDAGAGQSWPPSFLQSPQLTDHPGVAYYAKTATATS